MKNTKIITSEYVSYGHPDKVADQISDALLDEYISYDENTRAGIETMIKDNIVVVGGEVNTKATIDVEKVIRNAIDLVKYPSSHKLTGKDVKIINLIGQQSSEISNGVDKCDCCEIGAGDQGFVVGYASNETNEYMPLGVYIARQICKFVADMEYWGFGPDTKTQVCVEYGGRKPKVKTIIISTQHIEDINVDDVRNMIKDAITANRTDQGGDMMDNEIFFEYIKDKDIDFIINANGDWNVGGPISDCGITGRKIVVDQYGGYCNVGGGAFSGKDMTKVDRSAAYMCRYLAKNIVDAGLATEAKVELGYVISKPEPCSLKVELTNAPETPIDDLSRQIEIFIMNNIDLTPRGIICKFFPLGIEPIFYNTARNGHFGYKHNEKYYPWEMLDLSDELKNYIEGVELTLMEN